MLLKIAVLVVVLIGVTVWVLQAAVRRDHLNQALIAAIKHNDTVAVLAALDAGADPNARDNGNQPLSPRQTLLRFWNRLRGRHADRDDSLRMTPLLVALEQRNGEDRPWEVVTPPENTAIIKALLDRHADVNAADTQGRTPLMWAAAHGYTDTVRLLLDQGADVKARDPLGWTPLLLAVHGDEDYLDTINLLLEKGANANEKDREGNLPLTIAARYNHAAIAGTLIAHGADVNRRSDSGDTALNLAKRYRSTTMIALLQKAGAKQ
jgi:ankyrin repeat protein